MDLLILYVIHWLPPILFLGVVVLSGWLIVLGQHKVLAWALPFLVVFLTRFSIDLFLNAYIRKAGLDESNLLYMISNVESTSSLVDTLMVVEAYHSRLYVLLIVIFVVLQIAKTFASPKDK